MKNTRPLSDQELRSHLEPGDSITFSDAVMPVPEPTATALLLVGAVSAVAAARRQRAI